MSKHSIQAQISAQKREIAISETTYAKLVNGGKMRAAEADLQLDFKRAILATLEWLQANEAAIKAKVEAA